jgi:hypothetical protein
VLSRAFTAPRPRLAVLAPGCGAKSVGEMLASRQRRGCVSTSRKVEAGRWRQVALGCSARASSSQRLATLSATWSSPRNLKQSAAARRHLAGVRLYVDEAGNAHGSVPLCALRAGAGTMRARSAPVLRLGRFALVKCLCGRPLRQVGMPG